MEKSYCIYLKPTNSVFKNYNDITVFRCLMYYIFRQLKAFNLQLVGIKHVQFWMSIFAKVTRLNIFGLQNPQHCYVTPI